MLAVSKSDYIADQVDVEIYSPETIAVAKLHKATITLQVCESNCVLLPLLDFDD